MTAKARKITEADIENLPDHVGDHIPKATRLQLHREVEELHQANRNDTDDPGFRLILISAPKGAGKSTWATAMAMQFYIRGYFCLSNLSLLFGHNVLDASAIFNLGRSMPPRSVLVVDELQALASRYDQAALRSRSLVGGLAGLRKRRVTVIACTSQESMVSRDFLHEVDELFSLKPARWRVQPKGQSYPAWCHVRVYRIAPRPYAWESGKSLTEKYGVGPATRKPKLQRVRGVSPKHIFQAAALQSSFAELPYQGGEAVSIKASDMREALEQGGIIELEDADLEADDLENTAEAEAYQEQLQLDQTEITRLWSGVIALGLQAERSVPLPLLLTKMAMNGSPFAPSDLEGLLSRWTSRRSGSSAPVPIDELRGWFTPRS